jgi:hypothetical protein
VATPPFENVVGSVDELRTHYRAASKLVEAQGDPAVKTLDEHRLVIPDLSGNNLLDSLTNVVHNPHVGVLFVLPGRDETLRLEGAPDVCEMLIDQTGLEMSPADLRAGLEAGYARDLENERL